MDQYICPEDKVLRPYSKIEWKGRELTVYRGIDCERCPVRYEMEQAKVDDDYAGL